MAPAVTEADALDALLDSIPAPSCDFRISLDAGPCGAEPAGMAHYKPCGCTQYLCEPHRVGLLTFIRQSTALGIGIVCSGISASNAKPHTTREHVAGIDWRAMP